MRWLFSRTIWAMTLLRDFYSQTHTQPCYFHPLGVYTNPSPLLPPFCSHWTNLPKKLLEVTSQIVWHIQGMLCHFLLKTILFQQAVAQGYLLLQVGSPYYLKRKALEWSQRSTNEFHHSCIPLHHQQCTGAWHGNCARAVFCMFVAILVYWYVQLPK